MYIPRDVALIVHDHPSGVVDPPRLGILINDDDPESVCYAILKFVRKNRYRSVLE